MLVMHQADAGTLPNRDPRTPVQTKQRNDIVMAESFLDGSLAESAVQPEDAGSMQQEDRIIHVGGSRRRKSPGVR